MSYNHTAADRPLFLPYQGFSAAAVQLALLVSAAMLPVVFHLLGAPVRVFLPMHWPVIMGGLLYGWRAGAVTGACAPVVSFLISGYPLPNILPSMTAELFAYGFFAGVLRERYKLNAFASTAIAVIAGRIVFIISVVLTHRAPLTDSGYFSAALLPGMAAAAVQIALLPFIAERLIQHYRPRTRR
jgi:hypothetical protein